MLLFERGADVLTYPTPEDIFLLRPYLPMQSTVILYGQPTLGKTPIGWAMAHAVQTGGCLFGIKAQRGNALVCEFDMPIVLVKDRWQKAGFVPSFSVMFETLGCDTTQLLSAHGDIRHRDMTQILAAYNAEYLPRLIVIDALREVVRGDINTPGVADRIYGCWHALFPEATIVFIHHESKDKDPFAPTDPLQKATGNMEFVNIAQVGMRLARTKKGVYLSVTKTQASMIPEPRAITIAEDGVTIK